MQGWCDIYMMSSATQVPSNFVTLGCDSYPYVLQMAFEALVKFIQEERRESGKHETVYGILVKPL